MLVCAFSRCGTALADPASIPPRPAVRFSCAPPLETERERQEQRESRRTPSDRVEHPPTLKARGGARVETVEKQKAPFLYPLLETGIPCCCCCGSRVPSLISNEDTYIYRCCVLYDYPAWTTQLAARRNWKGLTRLPVTTPPSRSSPSLWSTSRLSGPRPSGTGSVAFARRQDGSLNSLTGRTSSSSPRRSRIW